ncbi:MAG: hypothetical protein QOD38_409 [Acidimicrobiaceae bacterium]|jgi:hypothetical protein
MIETMGEVRGRRRAEVLLTVPGMDDQSVLVVLVDKHGLTAEEASRALTAAKKTAGGVSDDDADG